MKKYYICFFILAALLAVGVLTSAYFYLYRPVREEPFPGAVIESESYAGDYQALAPGERQTGTAPLGENKETGATKAQMVAGPADAARIDGSGEAGPAGESDERKGSGGETGPGAAQSQSGASADGKAGPSGESAGEIPDGEKRYCLVAENGFLLVFAKGRDTVCLDTHMPLSEFPEKEQERLMDGIWFSTMIEIFNYLESYSS